MESGRGLRMPAHGMGRGGAGATTIEHELAATDDGVRVDVPGPAAPVEV